LADRYARSVPVEGTGKGLKRRRALGGVPGTRSWRSGSHRIASALVPVTHLATKTIRTARSRSSWAYLLGRGMGCILSLNEPSEEPSTIQ